jgi:hypothetical protein
MSGSMRIKIFIPFCLAVIIISGSICCNAQLIANKFSVYAGYETGSFHGNELINETNFTYPSLYPNFKSLSGFSLKILYNSGMYFGFGVSFSHLQANNWEYPDSMLYQGSKANMNSLSADIQVRTKFTETGIFNRTRIFLNISPTIGLSKLSLTNPLFDIREGNNSIPQPEGSSDPYYGLKGNLGAEVSLTQMIGIFIDYSYGYYRVSSDLYSDSHFANSVIEAGLVVKLMKNKRYFY